jgi:DNA-binding winged helix-turn-helix (wHTH) protein/TolB-like protein/tetratricopeptide (TPR) repeat protein
MSRQIRHFYEFGPFRVDATERRLLRDGQPIPLTPKAFDTLLTLVRQSGHLLTKDELLRTVWSDTCVEESNLTHYISALRRALGDGGNGYVETVPRVGYRFAPGVREIWDEGEGVVVENHTSYRVVVKEEQREEEQETREPADAQNTQVDRLKSALPRRRVAAFLVTAAALLLLAVVFVWTKSTKDESGGEPKLAFSSIAVLPFKTIGEGDEHLGLGMADTLIAKLSHVRQIDVRPLSAVHTFTSLGQDSIAAGRALGVDAVLDGRTQRAEGRIRVIVELRRVRDGAVLWTETFDEKSADIFPLQDQIAARLTRSMPAALTSEEQRQLVKRHTTNPEAYEAYLLGRFSWNKRTKAGFAQSVKHFRRAIRLDQGYALAYAGLADCYVLGVDPLPIEEHTRRIKETAGRALELDDTLAEAHASLAYYSGAVEWEWQDAEKGFKRAIELNSNYATAHHWYAYHLAAMGRLEEALAEIRRARELDPLSLIINTDVGHILYFAQQFDEAIVQYQRVLNMDANFAVAHWRLGEAYIEKGMYREAVAELNEASRLGTEGPVGWLGYAYANAGRRDAAQKAVTELKGLLEPDGGPYRYQIAAIYTALGDHEEALALLERTCEARDSGDLALIKVDPKLEELRSYPRFASLLRRMKLTS